MFIDEIVGGNIPREFIPSVMKGFKQAMKRWYSGRLPGRKTLEFRLYDGSYHDVDSDAFSFELCAKLGIPQCSTAKPSLLSLSLLWM
ncbi:MAG: hypothetical protein U5K69_04805 [Balneolaceae bacterium]|nr:hypothetical protein [Balneolaceae bacterium]